MAFVPRKKLSQNFILDPKTLSRLSKVTGSLYNKTVVEVGPGPGGITRAILEQGAQKVFVIEKDSRFLPSLDLLREASGNRLSIKIGDCLHFNTQKLLNSDLKSNWPDQVPNIRLIGNLPFNVATPYVVKLFECMSDRSNIFSFGRVPSILTFQHEVAYRLIAPPGDKHRCRLSVMAQNYAKIDYKYTLPGAAFVPTPEVNVGVAVLIPLSVPYIDVPFKFLERVVTTIMMHKQKSVFRTSLRLFPSEVRGKMAMQLLDVAGVSKDKRPLDLTMDDFARITYTYQDMIQKYENVREYINRDVKIILNAVHNCDSNEIDLIESCKPKYHFVI
uniref:rRNA adenine N(6)-methyltransferase n=1 Tax=Lepeophtheirus salmonis TaxID=72036 RepID=C1BVN7_LEPSM|nr:Mitochondrial dimethyladenosine transferase 1, mitochondrial precursor [Lepeophtheirus salmonis]